MIEYAKILLPRIIKWPKLFKKELEKCLEWLSNEERIEFRVWCYEKFYAIHPDILDEVFMNICVQPIRLSKAPEIKFDNYTVWQTNKNVASN